MAARAYCGRCASHVIFRKASSLFTRLFFAAVRTAFASSACSLPAKLPVLSFPVTFAFATRGAASAPPVESTESEEEGTLSSAPPPALFFFCCCFTLSLEGNPVFLQYSARSALVGSDAAVGVVAAAVGAVEGDTCTGGTPDAVAAAGAGEASRWTGGGPAAAASATGSRGGVFCGLAAGSSGARKR